MVAASIAHLNLLKSTGKAVLVAEYPQTTDQLATLASDIAREGFVPLLLTRALDGPSLAPIERPLQFASLLPSSSAGISPLQLPVSLPSQPARPERRARAAHAMQSSRRQDDRMSGKAIGRQAQRRHKNLG